MEYFNSHKTFYRNALLTSTMLISLAACSSGGGDSGTPRVEPEPLDPIFLLTSGSSGIVGFDAHISADGHYIVFSSFDTNLVENDTNTASDIFRYDTQTNEIIRVSVSTNGLEANESSFYPRINADGRYVIFLSNASDLSPNDSDFLVDVFVRDIVDGTTTLVSVSTNGDKSDDNCMQADISSDGTLVTFSCESSAGLLDPADDNTVADVFIRNLSNNTTDIVTYRDGQVLNGDSFNPAISGNGRFIAFTSQATNLVSGDTNAADDVFVCDIQTGQIELISENTAGDQAMGNSGGAALSQDGALVSFYSNAANLAELNTDGLSNYAYVRNRLTNVTTLVSVDSQDTPLAVINWPPALSANGQFTVFQAFESGGTHIRVRDLQNNTTEILDKNTRGEPADTVDSSAPWISEDGRYVVFQSDSTNLVEGYVLDREYFYRAPNLLY